MSTSDQYFGIVRLGRLQMLVPEEVADEVAVKRVFGYSGTTRSGGKEL